MKKLLAIFIIVTQIGLLSVSAEDSNENMDKKKHRAGMQVKMKKIQTPEMKELRKERNESLRSNMDEMKNNLKTFRGENNLKDTFSGLDEDIKDELKELNDTFKEESKSLMDEIKNAEVDDKDALVAELEELREAHYNNTIEILGDNQEAIDAVNDRKDVALANKELREKNRETRKEYRGEMGELIHEHKLAFFDKVGGAVGKMKTEKLEGLLVKLDEISEKINNSKLSDEKKEEFEAKIVALREIVEDQIDLNAITDEDPDLTDALED